MQKQRFLYIIFIMRKNVYLLVLLLATLFMPCKGQNAQKLAKNLNRTIDSQLDTLTMLPADSATFYKRVSLMMKNALVCDFYDASPVRGGAVNSRYRELNSKRLLRYVPELENAGFFYYNKRQNSEAMDYFRLYLDCSESALFHKYEFNKGQVAYYLSLLSYGKKDFTQAERFADVALKDVNYARDAAEIKINCMHNHLKTHADSTQYLIALLELHDITPTNSVYTGMLLEYFSSPGHESEMKQFALDETRKHPENKETWALRGELDMKESKWDDAIKSFERAIDIDSIYVEAIYNTAFCICSKAAALQDSLQNSKKRLSKDDIKGLRAQYEEGQKWLERTSALDPEEKAVNWRRLSEQIEKVLGKNKKK